MRDYRNASQILFGFLPDQTVDLRGKIWKVREWRHPVRKSVDDGTLRSELLRISYPWTASKRDGAFAKHLRQGRRLEIHSLDRNNGVTVDPFPDLWRCRSCFRLYQRFQKSCACGSTRLSQLPFVQYHECGALRSPYIPTCKQHKQAKVILPGTTALSEIRIVCPICNITIQNGLGFSKCPCGSETPMRVNVHRASSVYTPRSVVVVNPPTPERVRRLTAAGGPDRALSWVLDGMSSRTFEGQNTTADALRSTLKEQGLPDALVEQMVSQAAGQLTPPDGIDSLPDSIKGEAASAAVTLAMAVDESRTTIKDLGTAVADGWSDLANLYRHSYPAAFAFCGLEAVELIDRFPVLSGNFAYTRGDTRPGVSDLRPFQAKDGTYIVYGDIVETEALLVKLQPSLVARWLVARGFKLDPWTDERSARLAILEVSNIPPPGAEPETVMTAGEAVLELVHSMSHRFIRRAAVFAGIEGNALSELLVPHHLAFLIYASTRGDFVLGGLQAVFEGELHRLLHDIVHADSRCALDPGCRSAGGACMACLHIGEPSCRYYNQFLDRTALFGEKGFLRLALDAGP